MAPPLPPLPPPLLLPLALAIALLPLSFAAGRSQPAPALLGLGDVPPPWPATWLLNMSTAIMPANYNGWTRNVSKWGCESRVSARAASSCAPHSASCQTHPPV